MMPAQATTIDERCRGSAAGSAMLLSLELTTIDGPPVDRDPFIASSRCSVRWR